MKWSTLNRLCAIAGAAAVLTVAALLVLVLSAQPTVEQEDEELPVVYDKPATLEASEHVMTVSAARTDGVLYDLPSNIHQAVTCDRNNREYMVLWTDEGGLTVEPILEADGTPAFMPQM